MDGLKSRPQKKKLSKNLLQMKSQVQVVPQDSLQSNPFCPHGPTILFQRSNQDQFHACSAFRDPKQCHQNKPDVSRRRSPWNQKQAPILYCHTCQTLDSKSSPHCNHQTTSPINIQFPSTFLKPLNDDKAQAQYHFQKHSTDFLLNAILSKKKSAILCIGAPTLHERLREKGANSLMMDIDDRYASFYPMLMYNMFNHHFFVKEDKDIYQDFLREKATKSLTVVMDPPFGGKVELLSATIKAIEKDWNHPRESLRVFWIFPYFMEKNILECSNDLRMMGVPIEYHNHAKYSRRKQGSPVRLFTNVSLDDIPLKGQLKKIYRKCNVCQVISGGPHCKLCNICPSKNGGSYVHCNICRRCVKDSWNHCKECNRCALPDHPCDFYQQNKRIKLTEK